MNVSSRKSRLAASLANVMYTNAVYFPNKRIYQGDTPGMLNYGCVNHVYYAYANVALDGGVYLSDEWADLKAPVDGVQGGLGSLMHLKQKHPHLQVVLSIGGPEASGIYPTVAASVLLRDNFARSAQGLVDASGLDGIDIAWEYPNDAKQGRDFLALLAAIRMYLPEDRYILTVALPANKAILQFIDLRATADYVDHVNLMAYDFFGSWSSKTGHHAQLYAMSRDESSVASGVGYVMLQEFPPKKILLGIPVYGRSFLQAAGTGQSFNGGGGKDGTFEYNQLPRPGCKEMVDKRHLAAQCIGGDGGFVTYDNPETVGAKAAFCKQKGLETAWRHLNKPGNPNTCETKGQTTGKKTSPWPIKACLLQSVTLFCRPLFSNPLPIHEHLWLAVKDAICTFAEVLAVIRFTSPPHRPRPLCIMSQADRERSPSIKTGPGAAAHDTTAAAAAAAAPGTSPDDNGPEQSGSETRHDAAAAAAAAGPDVPPPRFEPLFTLLTNSTTNTTVHPRVHYVFSDDDPGVLASAATDPSQRALVVDLVPATSQQQAASQLRSTADHNASVAAATAAAAASSSAWDIAWASSLSPDFAVTASQLAVQQHGGEGNGALMLRVEGIEREPVDVGSGDAPVAGGGSSGSLRDSGGPGREDVDSLLDDFRRRMELLRKVVGENDRRREVLHRQAEEHHEQNQPPQQQHQQDSHPGLGAGNKGPLEEDDGK
ncbi:Endochitinase B1 [Paramyrothecium foliicola]|nr:Endochitinase B1 [Paramyrothecium foliicola]